MNKVQNVYRYWVDRDSNVVVRKWEDEEYKTINPHTHIFEKYWSYYCPICNFIPQLCHTKQEAEHGANNHQRYGGDLHKCVVEYRDHELVCWENREEFLEDIGVWVCKQELYV